MFERDETINVTQVVVDQQEDVKSHTFLSRVFGYMSIWLIITTVISVGFGVLFSYLLTKYPTETTTNAFMVTMIVSIIGVLLCGLTINFGAFFKKFSLMIPATLYSIFMGILMSTLVMFIDWYIIAMGFGITTGIFAVMYLIAKTTKRNLTPLAFVGFGLLGGVFLLFLVFGIIALINIFAPTPILSWTAYFLSMAIDSIVFIAILLITMYEMWNIVKISQKGEGSKNLAQYCAFSLYTDFIYILIRVIYFLYRIFGNSNR